MTFPISSFKNLPPLTIVPDPVDDKENFIQYFNRLYEQMAFVINERMTPYYAIPISDTPKDIPNLPQFGAFLVMVSGIDSSQPVKTWSLVKSDRGIAGVINILGTQAGTGIWAGIDLTITTTATNFQIAHNLVTVPATTATFNIAVIGTQIGNQ